RPWERKRRFGVQPSGCTGQCRLKPELQTGSLPSPLPLFDALQDFLDLPLRSLTSRIVVLPPSKRFRQAFHVRDLFVEIVGVLISFGVAQFLHQSRGRVPDVKWRRLIYGFLHVLGNGGIRGAKSI